VRIYYVKPGARFKEALTEVFALVVRGELEPPIAARYPMDKAAEALGMLVNGQAAGKIVLEA
jgi:synaptic vesicle membrane protein VAT-1